MVIVGCQLGRSKVVLYIFETDIFYLCWVLFVRLYFVVVDLVWFGV